MATRMIGRIRDRKDEPVIVAMEIRSKKTSSDNFLVATHDALGDIIKIMSNGPQYSDTLNHHRRVDGH